MCSFHPTGTFPVVSLMVGEAVQRLTSGCIDPNEGTINSTLFGGDEVECTVISQTTAINLSFLVGIIMVCVCVCVCCVCVCLCVCTCKLSPSLQHTTFHKLVETATIHSTAPSYGSVCLPHHMYVRM